MNAKTKYIIWKSIAVLTLLQLCRVALKQIIFLFVPRTLSSEPVISMAVMILMTMLIVGIAAKKGMLASVFPKERKGLYIAATVGALILLVSGPILTKDASLAALLFLCYSSVVTPIFEEIIFRGYLWNALSEKYHSEAAVGLITAILFGLWHLGYLDSIIFRTSPDQLAFVMLMKAGIGLCYGLALGLLRYKTKNCYSTMLLHGIMNLFGR